MRFPKFHGLLAGALCAMCLAGHRAGADETGAEVSTNRSALRTVVRSEEIPDTTNAKPLQRAFFSAGTNRFTFVLPEDFKLDASAPDKIILTSPDYTCFITLQLINPATGDAAGLVVDSFRNQALDDFPLGAISNEFELRAANHSGPAYELRWKNSNGAQQLACVGFVPSGAGLLKFSLLSNEEQYPKNQTSFRCLVRSFQNNENGQLDVRPVSGAS